MATVNFVDIIIYSNNKDMELSLFHRPTTTDIFMPMNSSHRHRYGTVSVLFSRMNQCHVSSDENTKE
jgi:hypothetical protein